MRGVITEINGNKCIVLFNNGKIGSIPMPGYAKVGTVVTVSRDRKGIFILAALLCATLIAAFFAWRFLYGASVGYLYVANGPVEMEFSYNRFERVLDARPLTQPAVKIVAELLYQNKKVEDVFLHFSQAEKRVRVYIAQDDLAKARELEQRLRVLTQDSFFFKLYTIELYRKAMEIEKKRRKNPVPERYKDKKRKKNSP